MPDQKVHKKTSFEAFRRWCGKQTRSLFQSGSRDSHAQVDDFLAHQPRIEFHQAAHRHPHVQADASALNDNFLIPQPRAQLPRPAHRHSYAETDAFPGSGSIYSSSTASLADTLSYGSTTSSVQPALLPGPRPRQCEYWGPDDLSHFRSDLQGQAELRSGLAMPSDQPRLLLRSFAVDSFAIRAGSGQPRATHKPSPSSPIHGKGPAEYQTYPEAPQRKPAQAHYIPPSLQPGYVNGVPPALQARHSTANLNPSQPFPPNAAAATDKYSHPLVDFSQGLFFNADMSEANISSRHQEPRIPEIYFPSRGLTDEFDAELTRMHMSDEKEVFRPEPRTWMSPDPPINPRVYGMEVFRPEPRAWMSPGPPLNPRVYEMEAAIPDLTSMRARGVLMRSRTPRVVTMPPKRQRVDTLRPAFPPLGDIGHIKPSQYSWPRYGDTAFADPAIEHSRRYRDRRRDIWRNRERNPD